MGRLFGTNGVRGVFGSGFTLETAARLSFALSERMGPGPVLVGYDGRDSSPLVARTVCAALNSRGIDCSDAGLVPTPCLELAVKKLGYSWGIMATASHNPPEYAGIKPCAGDGVEIPRETEAAVEESYFGNDWPHYGGPFGKTVQEPRAIGAYLEAAASHIDAEAVRSARLRVVLDTGNGAQAAAAPEFCRMLGCDVEVINGQIDGMFPGRGSEPTVDNLGGLSEAVARSSADLGVAFDGDGDRSMFCDAGGRIMPGETSALVLARRVMEKSPGAAVVTCLNSGSAVDALASAHGARVIRTRVGSVEVSRRMIAEGAQVGFEENGGFMYGPHNQVRDGVMTLGLALEAVALSGRPLAELASQLPPSHTAKSKLGCPAGRAAGVVSALAAEFEGADLTDGIKVALGPSEWVMIRPSGTEPVIRIYAEAPTEAGLEALMGRFEARVRALIS